MGKEQSNSHDYDTWGHVENSWSGPEHPEAYSQRSRIDYIMFTEGEVEETKLDVKAEMETRFFFLIMLWNRKTTLGQKPFVNYIRLGSSIKQLN